MSVRNHVIVPLILFLQKYLHHIFKSQLLVWALNRRKKHLWFDARNNFALKSKQNLLRKCIIKYLWANQHQVDQTGLALLPWWVTWLKVTNVMKNVESFKTSLYVHPNICNILGPENSWWANLGAVFCGMCCRVAVQWVEHQTENSLYFRASQLWLWFTVC